jgi:hypothetical protein
MNEQNGTVAHEYLRARAVSIETALANRVEFPPATGEGRIKARDYMRRLGFNTWSTGGLHEIIEHTIWFPCLDQNGSPETWICKPFPSPPGKNGDGHAKFLTETSFYGYPLIPATTWKAAHSPNKPLLLTEGPVKALAALQAGAYALGVNGVWQTAEKDKETGATALHPLLINGFSLSARAVYLAFDADFSTNPSVRHALIRTAILFLKAGAEVKILRWPIEEGKGLDDHLFYKGGNSGQVLTSLYSTACQMGDILRPCDMDHVRSELILAKLADSKLNQICKMVASGLGVRASNLEKECKHTPKPASPKTGGSIDSGVLEGLSIYYDPERSCYWTKNNRDNWIKINGGDVQRYLAELGFDSSVPQGENVSETDRIINAIQRSMDVEYVASLAGYQKGMIERSGRRLLILDSPVFVTPQKGDWSTFAEFLLGLLGNVQLPYLYGWLKVALEALYGGKFRPGQSLVLAGPKDCGKSLLQNLITILLGGRSAKPHQYMSGLTSFNGDLFAAEHLMIEDEEPATDIRSRRNFGTKLKEITANVTQRCHFKYRSAIPLEPLWRNTISLNDETENLMILPPWDDSIEDKMILLKATRGEMPMPTVTNEERALFWAKLVGELPAFVDFLFSWEIPQDLLSNRYGITHYQDPDLLASLRSLAPEYQLLELIDAEIFKFVNPIGRPTNPWEGKAAALEQRLTADSSSVRYGSRKLLSFQAACGTYLGRLEKLYRDRVSSKRAHSGGQVWVIQPPPP